MLRVHYRHDNITKGFDFRSRSVLQAKSQMSFLLPNDRRQGTEGTAKTQKKHDYILHSTDFGGTFCNIGRKGRAEQL